MHPRADHSARRAAGLGSGFDAHPSLPKGKDLGVGDAIVGQVANAGGSIGCR